MTHTPGPWAARGYQFHIADAGEFIGECYPMNDGGIARARANAALIAAAPELLAALEDAYTAARNWIPTNAGGWAFKEKTIKQIDAAIARATGQA